MNREEALRDIDEVVAFDTGVGGTGAVVAYVARGVACILRHAPAGSTYAQEGRKAAGSILDRTKSSQIIWGLLTGLRADVDQGKLDQFEELVRADMLSDFLDQAVHLLRGSPDYRRAAAVLGGGALEENMRKLAVKFSIAVVTTKGEPKKASQINSDLYAAHAYGKPDHALVDAWLKIRNDAAHGAPEFEANHSADKVDLMLAGIREFVARLPA